MVRCSPLVNFIFILIWQRVCLVGCTSKPIIILQPKDVIVTNRQFTVLCSTSKTNTVRWFRDNREINFRSSNDFHLTKDGSLYVTSAYKQRDEGTYQCLVTNKRGAVLSSSATVKFPYLNKFTRRDWLVAKTEGEYCVLRCVAPDSFPDGTVYWSRVDPMAPGGTVRLPHSSYYTLSSNDDLHFAYLRTSDAGDYSCTVTNGLLEQHVTRTISVSVGKAPALTSMPPRISEEFSLRRTAIKGETFVLECIVYGLPVPRIALRKRGLHVQLGKLDGNARKLVIKSFARVDAGKYKCKATDPSRRTTTRTTYITMEAKPEWIVKPKDLSAGLKSSVTIPCKAYGIPSVSYEWFFNGDLIGSSSKYSFTGGNLTITRLGHVQGGMYQCVVRNKHGELYSDMELRVQETPAGFGKGSRRPLTTTNALVGTTVQLYCNPTGNPKPIVTWEKGSMIIRSRGRFRVLANGNLQIKNATIRDSGRYTCEVTNRLGRASRSGKLTVHNDTAITRPPSSITVNIGQDIRLTCGVSTTSSIIEVNFEWQKSFMKLPRNPRYKVGKKNKTGFLSIVKVGYQDSGVYTCRVTASGTNAMDTAHALVTVQGPPDPPTNVRLGDITRNRVNITWSSGRNNNSPIKKVFIQYATTFNPRTWTYFKAVDNGAWVTKTELVLSPWVEYKFRLIAMNGVGNSTHSASSSIIKTPPAAPIRYPKNITSIGTSPSTLEIYWEPLSPVNQNGPGIHYFLYHRRANSSQSMQLNQVPRNTNKFVIKGTEFYAKYEFQIQAVNIKGAGPKSPIIHGYSGETFPVGKPTNLKVRITSSKSAFVSWTGLPNKREFAGGKLLGYKVYFWSNPSITKPKTARFTASVGTSTSLKLRPFTSYKFQVVAFNRRGDGPPSSIVGPLRMPETIPDPPDSITLNVQNATYALMEWAEPARPNGYIFEYELTYRKLPQDVEVKKLRNSRYFVLKKLDTLASYQVTVLARNGVGRGPPLVEVFDLKSAPSVAPKNVRVLYDDQRKDATILWDRLTKQDNIDGYRVFYWSSESLIHVVDVERTEGQRTIGNLEAGNMHHFQVAARKKVNQYNLLVGPRSEVVRAGKVNISAIQAKSGTPLSPRSFAWLWISTSLVTVALFA